jgi:hypothetical protein
VTRLVQVLGLGDDSLPRQKQVQQTSDAAMPEAASVLQVLGHGDLRPDEKTRLSSEERRRFGM